MDERISETFKKIDNFQEEAANLERLVLLLQTKKVLEKREAEIVFKEDEDFTNRIFCRF
ncbi:hypothetical protein OROHE_023615 [Orobanche hederae]